ncbi:hypothetical protein ANCCAN_11421 [Ancylostoma caninum]|uniref:Uncharacterized protein n=1 Tax=Ancylostoma caninum TaxID=29170 RepID=A0A368GH88_ANCCA|nr:hypothetical protein ANCCAN_11421 [Ancylostoma caninum]
MHIFQITEFCKFTEEFLSAVKDDSELLEVINTLDTTDSFDSLTGSNLVDHLVGRLSRDGVAKWLQTADKRWSLRHVSGAFAHWSNEAKVEALTNLLKRPKSEEVQYTVGNCLDSMFKMKVRAGELVSVSLIEGGEEVLRKSAESLFGKDVVKSAVKKMKANEIYKGVLPVFWMCLKLWSKIASTDQMTEMYQSNADELHMVVKEGEEGIKVLLDQLLALLSQPQKYHRTVVYYVYVSLMSHIKDEHVSHIIETLTMDDDELADEEDSDEKSDEDEGKCAECKRDVKSYESMDAEEDEAEASEAESSGDDDDEDVDPETLSRLESALGKAAVKRKAGAMDEEESDASDVDDAEMFAMDERLAAAFKAMAPKKEKYGSPGDVLRNLLDTLFFSKLAAHMASAFRLKLADLLLFTLSSQNTATSVKVAHLPDGEIVTLLDQLIQEGTGISNPALVSAVASLSSFICSLGISGEGTCSDAVLEAFVGLFERFMSQEDGLIGCELAIAAVIKHPEVFVPRSKTFLKAGFNSDYRIFRRTEAVLCLAGMMSKSVQGKISVEKSTVKGVAKSCTEYLRDSIAEPDGVKPRFFASVLKLLLSTASGISEELKPTLQKHLSLEPITENEATWNTISKKVNAACQQTCGKSAARVLDAIQNAVL